MSTNSCSKEVFPEALYFTSRERSTAPVPFEGLLRLRCARPLAWRGANLRVKIVVNERLLSLERFLARRGPHHLGVLPAHGAAGISHAHAAHVGLNAPATRRPLRIIALWLRLHVRRPAIFSPHARAPTRRPLQAGAMPLARRSSPLRVAGARPRRAPAVHTWPPDLAV
mmetsp:Transcript_30515/g.93310  ORF Transcript_30515/g.93310 Transcript_30515/m.93310 type:complete len:169 (-) Transcript_30515:46-552(-)